MYCKIPDHPIHPPTSLNDPWDCPFPPNKNYFIKSEKGVFNVYKDSEYKERMHTPFPDLAEFVQDMQTMCNMIADGPL